MNRDFMIGFAAGRNAGGYPYVNKTGPIVQQNYSEEAFSVGIKAIQAGNGDPSPSNIRPITGWTGAKIFVAGKNLFDKNNPLVINGYFQADGEIISSSSHRTIWIPCLPNTTYTVSKVAVLTNDRLRIAYTKTLPMAGTQTYSGDGKVSDFTEGQRYSFSVTTGADARYVVVWLSTSGGYADSLPTTQLEVGVATTYEAFKGNTYNIDWTDVAGTVYVGNLDVTLGKLRVTHVKTTIGDAIKSGSWQYSSPQTRWYHTIKDSYNLDFAEDSAPDIYSEDYKVVSYSSLTGGSENNVISCRNNGTNNYLQIRDTRYGSADVDAFGAYANALNVVIPLATPLEYDLTPTEIQLLVGKNNVYADCGDITVTWATP